MNIKMNIKMNKRAGERYLTPWMFIVWALIGIGIIMGVMVFYSAQTDVRPEEAEILAKRLIDCVLDDGYLKEEFLQNLQEDYDVFKDCSLDEEILLGGDFYFDISVFKNNELLREVSEGKKDFEMQCKLKEKAEAEHFAECFEEKIPVFDKNGNKLSIEIFTGSNQLGRKL